MLKIKENKERMGRLIIVTTQKWDYARWMHGQVSSAAYSPGKVPFSLLRGGLVVLDVPGLQHTAGLDVVVGVNHHGL